MTVYIVGAGPGNVDYLTVRSYQLLKEAEVLVYDALVDESVLKIIPKNCEMINVGKRGGQPSFSQTDIDKILVKQCQLGKKVVRLKSGDPFIFGRTASEIQALKKAHCDYEIVPGISTALGAPFLAFIPLTDPVVSRSFTVLTAHDVLALNWVALGQMETLVILMGGRKLGEIVECLMKVGRSLLTPVAIIRSCGSPDQKIWVGNLGNIVQQTQGFSLSPAVIIIGEVVNMRAYLQPNDQKGNEKSEQNNYQQE